MQTIINGMAVLVIRISCMFLAFVALRPINWRQLLQERHYVMAHYVYVLLALAVGHLVGDFLVTMIELLQQLLLNALVIHS